MFYIRHPAVKSIKKLPLQGRQTPLAWQQSPSLHSLPPLLQSSSTIARKKKAILLNFVEKNRDSNILEKRPYEFA